MEKSKGKKITIEKLAEMINNGFEKTATKLQLQNLENKVDKMDERLKNVEEKLEDIGELRPRVKKLEEALEID